MAREISDYNGTVEAPSSDYPYGRIKDNPGGTRVDEKSNGDLHVFAQDLMSRAHVTPNGQPDNTTNGFQLMEAFCIVANVPAPDIEIRTNLNGDTIAFDKSRTIVYSATTGSPDITPIFDMSSVVIGSEIIISTPLPGSGVFIMPTAGGTINYLYESQIIIGTSSTGTFVFKVVGRATPTSGDWYITARFFGY
jgi:hypothetical protein